MENRTFYDAFCAPEGSFPQIVGQVPVSSQGGSAGQVLVSAQRNSARSTILSRDVETWEEVTEGDVHLVAKTLYGEARGEWEWFGIAPLIAVANVILNRVRQQTWFGRTLREVCLKPLQFSCWNEDDPNREAMDRVEKAPSRVFDECCRVARGVLCDHWPDLTGGADHYYSVQGPEVPKWARGKTPTCHIGRHVFFKLSSKKENEPCHSHF